jgi:hypothetical protein
MGAVVVRKKAPFQFQQCPCLRWEFEFHLSAIHNSPRAALRSLSYINGLSLLLFGPAFDRRPINRRESAPSAKQNTHLNLSSPRKLDAGIAHCTLPLQTRILRLKNRAVLCSLPPPQPSKFMWECVRFSTQAEISFSFLCHCV